MCYEELNQHIYRYFTGNKTKSAIMLTAPWGTGKSFYIQNHLKPFLEGKEKKDRYKCIIVSLYDVSSTAELSKALFFENKALLAKSKRRSGFFAFSKPLISGAICVGKTVLKTLTTIDIDFNVSNPNWQKLYTSVDFTNKLIVLEDLERSKIDILEVLGYVNSLVEQDGAKVLLVANEDEILTTRPKEIIKDGKKEVSIEYTECAAKYLRIKEKTVSDTIKYEGDISLAIKEVLISFENEHFNRFLEEKDGQDRYTAVVDIRNILDRIKNYNLRSVIFGCQKTIEIYDQLNKKVSDEFLRSLLCGNIAFSLRLKKDDKITWNKDDGLLSQSLGVLKFPLFRFAYDYIIYHQLKVEDMEMAYDQYCQRKNYERSQKAKNQVLENIYNFYCLSEEEVSLALSQVVSNLENTTDIFCEEFGKLANYLVAIHGAIGHENEIKRCKAAMIRRLREVTDKKFDCDFHFSQYISLDTAEECQEFATWKKEMINALKEIPDSEYFFDYCPEHITDFYKMCSEKSEYFENKHCFAAMLDVDKVVDLLKMASPDQINLFRGAFIAVYSGYNIGNTFAEDKVVLKELKEQIDALIHSGEIEDKIVLLQTKYFSDNLQSILDKM